MFLDIDKKKSEQLAALSMEGSITYGQLVGLTKDIESLIGSRNLIFAMCRNSLASLVGYVGFMASGNVPLLLSSELDKELIKYLLDSYNPNYIWCPACMCETFSFNSKNSLYSYGDYVLMEYSTDRIELYNELALLLTTSGSTGSPKLVRISYNNLLSNASSIAEYLMLDDTERPITMLPMNYTYGLSVINSHLLVGATILMTEYSYAQKPFWDFFNEYGATSVSGVPFTYEFLKKLRFFKMELPSLRYMTQAGGKLSPELHKEYAEYADNQGKRFYVMYGQTEATARMAYLPYEKSLEKYGSMGIAIPGGEFSLIDIDGKVIADSDTIGELVYRGPNVTLGYAQAASDLACGDERGGVLMTGDMAKRDRDGFYYIVGRKKRFLKIYGNRVNLDECERLIQGEYENVDCACVGEDDHMLIYVTATGIEKQVEEFISKKTGLNKNAFDVLYIADIPKNDSGKKQYSRLYKQ